MKKFTVKIKSLTPIWTGDADRKSIVLRETGIIGSLRWWYEALVRGYGGTACDPTDKSSRCPLDQCKSKEARSSKSEKGALNSNICSVCQLFGCTGWARKFKLEIDYKEEITPLFFTSFTSSNRWWLNRITKEQHEILWSKEPIKLNFILMSDDKDFELENIIKTLVLIISQYGGLGAKLQYGFGQFNVDIDKVIIREGIKLIKNSVSKIDEIKTESPSFLDFFMLKFKISSKSSILKEYMNNEDLLVKVERLPDGWDWDFIPCAFDIKYKGKINNLEFGLREYFRKKYNNTTVKEIFGYSNSKDDKRKGGNIFVSHLYKENNDKNDWYYLKIYGFLPKDCAEELKSSIKDHLKDELKAEIDKEVSGKELLEEILNGKW